MAAPALQETEVLGIWERGLGQSPARRALALLAAADPGASAAELATRTVGERDAALLDLRERAFGARLTLTSVCDGCGERLEATLDVRALRVPAAAAVEELCVDDERRRLVVRLPIAGDLVAIESVRDVEAGRRALLERCVIAASVDGVEVDPGELPDGAIRAAAERMARADPQADLCVALSCPGCGAAWEEPFDPGTFLWLELDARAQRLLREVHELASAYGWSEADVLAVPASRRRHYLELAAG
jgi:hypothetical protein